MKTEPRSLAKRWTDLPLSTKGLVVAAIPVVPLIVSTLLFWGAHTVEQRVQESVTRASTVKAELLMVFVSLLDAETGVRGYLLTGDDAFLDPYRRATEALPQRLTRLDSLIQDPGLRSKLSGLRELSNHRLRFLAELVSSRGRIADVSGPRLAEGKRRMDLIRVHLRDMIRAQEGLLASRQTRAQAIERATMLLVLLGGLVGVGGGLGAAKLLSTGVVGRIQILRENAARLTERQSLLPFLSGADEIGALGSDLQRAAGLLADRDRALQTRMEEVAAANKELEAFSYSVSHDLRAPLRHIAGFATLLETRAAPRLNEEDRRHLKRIGDAAARMGRLVDDLLSFSRMGRADMMHGTVNLDAVVEDVVMEARRDANGRRIEWKRHPLPVVRGDRALLRVALSNLVSNAVKYTATREVAEIEIGAMPPNDGERVLYVRDNGVGFDMAYADKLFGVFQRLHAPDEFEGTGIGLANVRRIAQRHGGTTWAQGTVDGGATFYLSLPAEIATS